MAQPGSIGLGAPTDAHALVAARTSTPVAQGADAAPTPTAAVRLDGVTRLFERQPALRAVALEVPVGQTVVLRGPNGAGKSTLLRLIATAIAPTFGGGVVLGHDLIEGRDAIRGVTELLGHRSRLYEDLTARENLRFACALHGMGPERIGAALARVGLADAADGRIRGFSQGMRQRVALARLLLRDPELLLLDEPYAGLDEEGKHLVDEVVLEAGSRGRTVVLATHDRARELRAAREVWMDEGRIVAGAVLP